MPRHRIEHEPRHRAPRPDRRVQLSGASSRSPSHAKPSVGPGQRGKATDALGTGPTDFSRPPSHAKPSAGPGQLGKAFDAIGSGASERLHTAGTRLRREQRDLLSGAARGLMVSPWFAAGAGFVIAAGAFMYAPHASLSFGNGATSTTRCSVAGCTIPQQEPTMAGGASGLVTPSPSPSSSGHVPRHAAHEDSAPDFTYSVQPNGPGLFQMTFTMISKQPVGNWRLSFGIPGATDLSVAGANWASLGADGGTASGSALGGSSQSPGPNSTAGSAGGHSAGSGQPNVVSFVVDGKGQPNVVPDHGSFDGAPCQFSQH